MAFVILKDVYKRYHVGEVTTVSYTHLTLPTIGG